MVLSSVRNALCTAYDQAEPYVSPVLSWSCETLSKLASKIDSIASSRIKGWEPAVSWAKNNKYTAGIITGIVLCKIWSSFCGKKSTGPASPERSPYYHITPPRN